MPENPERPLAAHVRAAITTAAQPQMADTDFDRQLATHVHRAIAGSLQSKMQVSTEVSRQVALHVREAVSRQAQANLQDPAMSNKKVAAHVQRQTSWPKFGRGFAPHVSAAIGKAVQGKPGPTGPVRYPASSPSPPSQGQVIQSMNYSENLLDESISSGAKLKSKSDVWLDLDTVKRSYLSWFSKKIQEKLGVEAKPKPGDICRMCGKPAINFELDHMTPWRQYTAALISSGHTKKDPSDPSGKKTLVRADATKALYNDPENLWWICRGCNNPKSDIIPESSAHAGGDFSSGTKGRYSGYSPGDIMDDK